MYSDTQQNIRCIENLQRIGRIKSKLPPNPLPGFLAEPSENWYTNETAEVWDLCLHALHIVDFMATNELTKEQRREISVFFQVLCQHVVWIMECRIKWAPYDDIQAKTSLLEKYYDWRKKVADAFLHFAKDYDRTKAFKVFPELSAEQEKLYSMWELLMACKFNVVAKIEVPESTKGPTETEVKKTQGWITDLLPDVAEEDHRLFLQIGVDIRRHFDDYRDAGKWLDDYYDEARYWERTHSELEGLRHVGAEGEALTPKDERRKEALEELIEEKRPPMLDCRLQEAWWELFKRYTLSRGFLGQNEAKALLLIAWLATDVDADKADLNLTRFEKWPWKCFGGPVQDNDITGFGRFCLMSFLWSDTPENANRERYEAECLRLVRAAWARREAEKDLTGRPTETEHKNIWEDISPDMKKAIQDFWKESKAKKTGGKRSKITDFCRARSLDEKTFRSEKERVEKRMKRPGWSVQ